MHYLLLLNLCLPLPGDMGHECAALPAAQAPAVVQFPTLGECRKAKNKLQRARPDVHGHCVRQKVEPEKVGT